MNTEPVKSIRVALFGVNTNALRFVELVSSIPDEGKSIRFTRAWSRNANGSEKLSDYIQHLYDDKDGISPAASYNQVALHLENTPGNPDGSLFGGCNPIVHSLPSLEDFERAIDGHVLGQEEPIDEAKVDFVIFDEYSQPTGVGGDELVEACIKKNVPFFIVSSLPDFDMRKTYYLLEDSSLPYVGYYPRTSDSLIDTVLCSLLNTSNCDNGYIDYNVSNTHETSRSSIVYNNRYRTDCSNVLSIRHDIHVLDRAESMLRVVKLLTAAHRINICGDVLPITRIYTTYRLVSDNEDLLLYSEPGEPLILEQYVEYRKELEMIENGNLMALGNLYESHNGKFKRK